MFFAPGPRNASARAPVSAPPRQSLRSGGAPIRIVLELAPPFAILALPPMLAVTDPIPTAPKLLDRVRWHLRVKRYSIRTEKSYLDWIRRYILFHRKRHPSEMGEKEIAAFLNHLAVNRTVAASTQNQALCALLFLYQQVLERKLEFIDLHRAKRPPKIPVVFTRAEARAVLAQIKGDYRLMAHLLYGSGLRLLECLRVCASRTSTSVIGRSLSAKARGCESA